MPYWSVGIEPVAGRLRTPSSESRATRTGKITTEGRKPTNTPTCALAGGFQRLALDGQDVGKPVGVDVVMVSVEKQGVDGMGHYAHPHGDTQALPWCEPPAQGLLPPQGSQYQSHGQQGEAMSRYYPTRRYVLSSLVSHISLV